MCPLLRNGGMIVVSLITVALSALSASAFCPPAFCVGPVTAARARTTVVAYGDNADSKDKRTSELENRLKESYTRNLNLVFEIISGNMDRVDWKIDKVAKNLKTDIDDVKMGLDRKFDGVAEDIKTVSKDLNTIRKDLKTAREYLVAMAHLGVAPQPSQSSPSSSRE